MSKKPEKPKSRKAPAPKTTARKNGAKAPGAGILDPVFAVITEHKALLREHIRLRSNSEAARDKAEKKHGKLLEGAALIVAAAEDTKLEYDQFVRAANAERKAAMRMARTKPTTISGAAALITHTRHEIKAGSQEDWEDWVPAALKTVAAALGAWPS